MQPTHGSCPRAGSASKAASIPLNNNANDWQRRIVDGPPIQNEPARGAPATPHRWIRPERPLTLIPRAQSLAVPWLARLNKKWAASTSRLAAQLPQSDVLAGLMRDGECGIAVMYFDGQAKQRTGERGEVV